MSEPTRPRYIVARTPDEGRRLLLATCSWRQWEATIEDLLTRLGWTWMHIRDARRQATTGWPDYLAVRGRRLLAIELKSGEATPTPAQRLWLERLATAGVETYVFRPTDLPEAERILQ